MENSLKRIDVRRARFLWLAALVILVLVAASIWLLILREDRQRPALWDSASPDGYGPSVVWEKGLPAAPKGDADGVWENLLRWEAVYSAAYNDHDFDVAFLEEHTASDLRKTFDDPPLLDSHYWTGPKPLVAISIEKSSSLVTITACGSSEASATFEEELRPVADQFAQKLIYEIEWNGSEDWRIMDRYFVSNVTGEDESPVCSLGDTPVGVFDPAPPIVPYDGRYGDL